ncbi:unnamed protein product [Urochloa decumbens]|uniref:Myb/SANT-like domain-containing protein n=1 Tax=Urochloa decumbens TaxID=240449 RepID=A0ABC9EQY3_9POAL
MAAAKGNKRVYLTWTDEMDTALLAVLVEHHNNGDHAQNGWKPHVYNAAIRNVREKCGVEITKDNIASRCKTFDKHYEIISKILSLSGFGWDWENDKLLIDSDDVWNRYVEVCARTGAESAQVAAEELEEATPDIPQKRQRTGEAILSMLGDMRTSFQDALKANEPLSMPQATPPAQILATLEEIPDLARSDLLRSYGKLILSERLVQALMELPMDMRKEWLLMLN